MKNPRLLTIFVIVFIDLLGFSLILPLLPYYATTYGASPAAIGLLVASYAAAQLIGAPLLGRLSDRYGRRPMLLLSVLGTFLSLLLLGFADPLGRALAVWAAPQAANVHHHRHPIFRPDHGWHHRWQHFRGAGLYH
jgi:MFS family permease